MIAVCGPTASGKSELSHRIAEALQGARGEDERVIMVDSMQVYREIPTISNQEKSRKTSLTGIVSVSEEWTVARHREAARKEIEASGGPCVLDAGTGMYLNAVLLDFPLAPKVPEQIREQAQEITKDEENPRRASRENELTLWGEPNRGSVWSGELVYETSIVYLKPNRRTLDRRIEERSRRIATRGLEEARELSRMMQTGTPPNPSVRDAIGARELMEHTSGGISLEEARSRISARTRRLARRQTRWFDKLASTLEGRAGVSVLTDPDASETNILIKHYMHGMI